MTRLNTQSTTHAIPATQKGCSQKPSTLTDREDATHTSINTDPCWESFPLLKFKNKTFELKHPLAVKFEHNTDGMWEASASKLGIVAFGDSPPNAFREFQEEFAVVWDAIAFESDDTLTEDARQLKATLRNMVK